MSQLSQLCKVLALGCVLTGCAAALGQSKDPFDESNKAQPAKQANASVEKPQEQAPSRVPDIGSKLFGNTFRTKLTDADKGTPKVKPTGIDDRIDLFVDVTPTKVRRGEIVKVSVRGVLRPGFHTYPMTKRADSEAQPSSGLSRFFFEEMPGLKALAPIQETGDVEFEVVKGVGTYLIYRNEFTWSQDFLVLPDSQPGTRTLRFGVNLVVCDSSCVPGEPRYVKTIEVMAEPAVALTPEIDKRLKEIQPPPTIVTLPAQAADRTINIAPVVPPAKSNTLLGIILVYMGGAFLMLFTPCVFPMIPITVSICLKQSQKEHHNALLTAAVYSLTIVVMLSVSMLLLGTLVQSLANNVWLNLGLGVLMVYFALSLFGMYEIELPRALANFTNAREEQGGYAGVIFMALTFTITSFTCTGPLVGPILAAAKESEMTFVQQVIAAVTYSATFAAPFFVLALFPSLTRKLPKSGGWLNAVKVVMGFVEMALAFKFLSNSDLAFFPGRPMLFNYETVLCAWIGLSIACGLYLLGIFRLPHDSPVEHLSVPRMLLAGMFLSFAIYICPALWRVTPQGFVGANVVAFLPLDTKVQPGEKEWLSDYETAYKQAAESDKLIFIDFTGQNCSNCRYNEKNVFPLPEIQQELKKYVRVQLYTDTVPNPSLSASEAEREGAKNSGLRQNTFNDSSNPLYAIIQPRKESGPFVDKDGTIRLSGADRNRVRKGQINDSQIPDFLEFLRNPLQTAGEEDRSRPTKQLSLLDK